MAQLDLPRRLPAAPLSGSASSARTHECSWPPRVCRSSRQPHLGTAPSSRSAQGDVRRTAATPSSCWRLAWLDVAVDTGSYCSMMEAPESRLWAPASFTLQTRSAGRRLLGSSAELDGMAYSGTNSRRISRRGCRWSLDAHSGCQPTPSPMPEVRRGGHRRSRCVAPWLADASEEPRAHCREALPVLA